MTLKTVPDLFRLCRGRETGQWRVGSESVRTVYLDSGDIVFASSNFQSDRLTTILVEYGKLTQGQMDHALTNLKPGMSIGKNLIEMGFITQRDLLDAARFQVERIVWSALTAPEAPAFEPMEDLEENIVRLPIDTPSLLFKGIMRIVDRESLLELLGPLNQVVFLQGKRVFELELPADLSKVAPLMDGTHTILELSSETSVEPMRVGAFALFLREIGWGKLYELPPLDRQALDRALTVNDPTKPPSAIPSPRSELFRTIDEASKKTVHLDHLSSLLDDIENAEDDSESDKTAQKAGLETESRLFTQAEPDPDPTQTDPSKPIGRVLPLLDPDPSEDSPLQEEPQIIISSDDSTDIPFPPTTIKIDKESEKKAKKEAKKESKKEVKGEPEEENKTGSKSWMHITRVLLYIIITAVVVSAAVYSFREFKQFKTRVINPPFTVPPPASSPATSPKFPFEEVPETKSDSDSITDVQPLTETLVPPPPEASPVQSQPSPAENAADISIQARFAAIVDGDTPKALTQGRAFQKTLSNATWTIRLIVACQGETLQNCAYALSDERPELFLTSINLKDGRSCYQLFMGCYSTKNAAEAEAKKLPTIFKEKGQTPKIMQISDIAVQQ
ncbi:MAG: hypothetical protein LBH03_01800 [Holophagales bacterium]|jgi:hypothetical protein|nr:hypothetical protein [Holophagales bacterium]